MREGYSAQQLGDKLIALFGKLPPSLRRTLTWDQGNEMFQHERIEQTVGMKIFFADPHSPWQRGTNENTVSIGRRLGWAVASGWCRQLEVTLENTDRLRGRVFRLTCPWSCRHRPGPLVLA